MTSGPTEFDLNATFTATDWRRGASLLLNYCRSDAAGVRSVLSDCDDDGDAAGIWAAALAALAFVVELSPALRGPEGIAALREATLAYAAAETQEASTQTKGHPR